MKQNPYVRCVAWIATLAGVTALMLLVFYLPVVAAIVFLVCVTFVAIVTGIADGLWKGVKVFIKDVLFGW